jgi:hypothetical protein
MSSNIDFDQLIGKMGVILYITSMVTRNIKLGIFIVSSLFMYGCYTQLLTSVSVPVQNVSKVAVIDSLGDTVYVEAPQAATATLQTTVVPCNCTPWEIETNSCWCTCDRCGLYHRLGYENCPTGLYRSYWGWDYYDRSSWWTRDSYRYNRRPRRTYYYPPTNVNPTVPNVINVPDRPSKNRNEIQLTPTPANPKIVIQPSNPVNISSDTSRSEPTKVIQTKERPSKGRNTIE